MIGRMELLARVIAFALLIYAAIVGLQLTFGWFSVGHTAIGLALLGLVATGFRWIRAGEHRPQAG